MAIDVMSQLLINKPKAEVASYALDPHNDPLWVSGIVESEMLTDPPLAQGSQVERVASFLGKRIQYILEVVDWEPGSRMGMHSIKGPFSMGVTHEFEEAPSEMGELGTLARIRGKGEASGLFKLASPLLAQTVKKSIGKDCKSLKEIMDARSPGSVTWLPVSKSRDFIQGRGKSCHY